MSIEQTLRALTAALAVALPLTASALEIPVATDAHTTAAQPARSSTSSG